jgi:Microcystin-dependent protein
MRTDPASLPPIGTIVMWGGITNCPLGWLVCDGSVYKQADYRELFAIIQHNFGAPPQSNTYNPATDFFVPDLRGRFVRGVDDSGKGRDPDVAARQDMQGGQTVGPQVGSVQGDGFKKHAHDYGAISEEVGAAAVGLGTGWTTSQTPTSAAGGHETRPANAYLYFIIKAR